MEDNKLRLNKEPINKKYKIDQDFFKQIDNEVKAYWLGYIMADGTIIVNNSYKLGLVSIDKELLEKFKQDTKSTHPIYGYLNKVNNKTIYSMAINDKIFDLSEINQNIVRYKVAIASANTLANGFYFSKEILNSLIPTIKGCPVSTYYDESTGI